MQEKIPNILHLFMSSRTIFKKICPTERKRGELLDVNKCISYQRKISEL